MTCVTALTFTSRTANCCPITGAQYVQPLIRLNGIPATLPKGTKLDPCVLPTLLKCNGAPVVWGVDRLATCGDLAELFATATPTEVLDTSPSIPSAVVGSDVYLLAKPTKWKLVPGTTNEYIPVYQF